MVIVTGPRPARIELQEVTKRFAGVMALDDVSVSISAGTVHALMGENGAGKSTLGKVIAGVLRPSSGRVLVDGAPVRFAGPHTAIAHGIATIQQEIALVPRRTVLENVFMHRESSRWGVIRRRDLEQRFERLHEQVPLRVEPHVEVGTLRLADQQKVEIMRALASEANVIVMDEPTAALTPSEAETLMAAIRTLRAQGRTVVYVSHFIDEVLDIADTVTVLRDGHHVGTAPAASLTRTSLIESMLGRRLTQFFPDRRPASGDTVLEVQGLSRGSELRDISFTVAAGEIVGVAGLVGSGRTELARALFGVEPPDEGTVRVRSRSVDIRSPRDAMEAGIAMLPESRKDAGLHLQMSVADNVTLPYLKRYCEAGVVRRQDELRRVDALMAQVDLPRHRKRSRVATLSGGNQQKVLFAKWLAGQPAVLIVDEPTRGVDIGAKAKIYEMLVEVAAGGMAVVLMSSDLEEVLGLSHRIFTMRSGRFVSEISHEDATKANVMSPAFGEEVAA